MDKYTKSDFARSVLITIDVQNDFTLQDAPARIIGTQEVIPNIVRLLELYREKGLLIIHAIRIYARDGSNVDLCRRKSIEEGGAIVAPGSQGAELVQELVPDVSGALNSNDLLSGTFQPLSANEFAMYKPRWGAFFGTRLEAFLKERGINTLVFSGCNYPNCPRASIYEASERDYRIVLVRDAISQLYPKGEEEMHAIGVNLHSAENIIQKLYGST